MLVVYGHKSNHLKINSKIQEVVCKEISSLWSCSFIESLYADILSDYLVIVVNPDFEILDLDSFVDFIENAKCSENLFFSPQINPKFFVNDPIWFSVKKLDCLQNFFVEFLYRNQELSAKFRNAMHKEIRGSSISRVEIPKYLTNLSAQWKRYENQSVSAKFLETYSHLYFKSPTNVHVAISNRCNLKCVMCPYHSPVIQPLHTSHFFVNPNFMQESIFSKIAQFCGENGSFLQFGQLDEPLLHPKFTQFLKIAKSYNVAVNLTTNGTLLNSKIASAIVDSSIHSITFSLDAIDRESYKRIRGYDYETTLSNIRVLMELLEKNKKEIELNVCFILQEEDAESKSKEFLEYWISKVKRVKFHQLTEYELNCDGILVPQNKGNFRKQNEERYPCSIPWKTLFVTSDSKVTFCCTSMAEYATSCSAGGGGIYRRFREANFI